jgi:hypothetical protein
MKGTVYIDMGFVKILKRIPRTAAMAGRAGILAPDAEKPHPARADLTIAEVGYVNEFGTQHVPERSYLRSTLKRERDLLVTQLRGAAYKIVFQQTGPRAALQEVGRVFAERVRATIAEGVQPENAPRTIELKGQDHTLQDTGALLHAISHDVVVYRNGSETAYTAIGASASEGFGDDTADRGGVGE